MGTTRLARVGAMSGALSILIGGVAAGGTAAAAAQQAPECSASPTIRGVPWAERMLRPERVWPFSRGDGVTVAVLDSAVDTTHPQLRGRIRPTVDYVRKASTGCVAHGTAVAGIIAAGPAGGVGFRGLAPSADVLPIRVSDRGPEDDNPAVGVSTLATAIRYAAQRAEVINISLVLPDDDPAVREAIADAIKQDVLVVAAVGNGHRSDDPNAVDRAPYPAAYPGVLGVGAIDETGARLPQSQVGSYVDLVAPGADVITTAPVGGHVRVSGTSYAAPFVAATAALVRAARPSLSASEVAHLLQATATPSVGGPGSRQYGAGIVDPYRAVTEVAVGGKREPLPSAPARYVDPAAVARIAAWRHTTEVAVAVAGWAALVLVLLLVALVVLRHGRRRNWRPGRASPPAASGPPPGRT